MAITELRFLIPTLAPGACRPAGAILESQLKYASLRET
jgi:hypothetical protein